MSRIRCGVPARAAAGAATVLMAVAPLMAAPAGAVARQYDAVSEAAYQTVLDLEAVKVHRAAVAMAAEPASAVADAEATYAADLGVVAGLLSPRTASAPDAFVAAWTAAGEMRMTVLLSALAELGVPYRGNTSASGVSFDCSGLTMYAWSQVGVSLAHQDGAQIGQSAARTWDTALAGDLVEYPGHVMMYLGAGHAVVDAPHSGAVVRVSEYSGRRSARLGSPLPSVSR
jgi:cell wall-associated NlpC family hydrolase